jgi:hypothetical protein
VIKIKQNKCQKALDVDGNPILYFNEETKQPIESEKPHHKQLFMPAYKIKKMTERQFNNYRQMDNHWVEIPEYYFELEQWQKYTRAEERRIRAKRGLEPEEDEEF